MSRKDEHWIAFNHIVLQAFDLDSYYLRICHSLLSMRKVRKTARENNKNKAVLKDISKQVEINEENVMNETAMVAEPPQG